VTALDISEPRLSACAPTSPAPGCPPTSSPPMRWTGRRPALRRPPARRALHRHRHHPPPSRPAASAPGRGSGRADGPAGAADRPGAGLAAARRAAGLLHLLASAGGGRGADRRGAGPAPGAARPRPAARAALRPRDSRRLAHAARRGEDRMARNWRARRLRWGHRLAVWRAGHGPAPKRFAAPPEPFFIGHYGLGPAAGARDWALGDARLSRATPGRSARRRAASRRRCTASAGSTTSPRSATGRQPAAAQGWLDGWIARFGRGTGPGMGAAADRAPHHPLDHACGPADRRPPRHRRAAAARLARTAGALPRPALAPSPRPACRGSRR
jgi:hypothetical protein